MLAVEGYKKKLLRLESLLTQRECPGEIKWREVVLGPHVAGFRRDQEEGGGAGPCS